jgi:hypothetical protein
MVYFIEDTVFISFAKLRIDRIAISFNMTA